MHVIIGDGVSGVHLASFLKYDDEYKTPILLIGNEFAPGGVYKLKRITNTVNMNGNFYINNGPYIYHDYNSLISNSLRGNKFDSVFSIENDIDINDYISDYLEMLTEYESSIIYNLVRKVDEHLFKDIERLSVYDYIIKYEFSEPSIEIIKQITLFTHGIEYTKLNICDFIFALYIHSTYLSFRMKENKLSDYYDTLLKRREIVYYNNTVVKKIDDRYIYCVRNNTRMSISYSKITFASNPLYFMPILKKSPGFENIFGPNEEVCKKMQECRVNNRFSFMIKFLEIPPLNKITPWGIFCNVNTNDCTIRGFITKFDVPSKVTKKTANEIENGERIVVECLHQLIDHTTLSTTFKKNIYGIKYDGQIYNKEKKCWETTTNIHYTIDESYLIPVKSTRDNIDTCGPHCIKTDIPYPCLENEIQSVETYIENYL